MYSRNESTEKFRDFSGKTINDSFCGWSEENLERSKDKSKDLICVVFHKGHTISSIECNSNSPSKLVGFICKQCRPNTYSYARRIDHKSTQSFDWTSTKATEPAAAPMAQSLSTPVSHRLSSPPVYLIIITLCTLLIVLLALALALSVFRNCHARAEGSFTACHADADPKCDLAEANEIVLSKLPQPQPNAYHRQSDTYDLYQYDSWAQPQLDPAVAMAPLPPSAAAGPDVRQRGCGLQPGPELLRSH